jgi:regulator of sirC expression with transglutaminase-like and TPR domain
VYPGAQVGAGGTGSLFRKETQTAMIPKPLSASSARERFVAIAHLSDREIDLAEAALVIAAEEQSGLDPRPWLRHLEGLAAHLLPRVQGARDEFERLERLTEFLFGEVGLRGNTEDYYDPRNSLLDQVLDRRLGIPITLAVVCIEVGRRVGVPLDGVGFPGHFLLRHTRHPQILLDPFEGGRLLTVEDCQEILKRVSGGRIEFEPRLLRPVGRRHILVRILNNLRGVYVERDELERALSVMDRILLLIPDDPDALRDRGLLALHWGDLPRGIADLERCLEVDPGTQDQEEVEAAIAQARRQLEMPH